MAQIYSRIILSTYTNLMYKICIIIVFCFKFFSSMFQSIRLHSGQQSIVWLFQMIRFLWWVTSVLQILSFVMTSWWGSQKLKPFIFSRLPQVNKTLETGRKKRVLRHFYWLSPSNQTSHTIFDKGKTVPWKEEGGERESLRFISLSRFELANWRAQ